MKLFNCANCGNVLYFENVACMRCGATLGFLPEHLHLATIVPASTMTSHASLAMPVWQPLGEAAQYRSCINYDDHGVCNWMLPIADAGEVGFCVACVLNGTIPDLSVAGNQERWRIMETEKHRLVYSLLQLGLPVVPRQQDSAGLEFAFLADTPSQFNERGRVMTGHSQGLITLNLAEADPVERERMRGQMAEPYRTILGHFRHESGHYYWDRLIRNTPWRDSFRALFGDETQDYGAALARHYRDGPPADWQQHCVSAYASAHPWEDWAETWAHYLHMVDTLETAYQFGLSIRPQVGANAALILEQDFNPYHAEVFATIMEVWIPLTLALNSLNRSMGHAHAYPFVLSARVVEKLDFVHQVVRDAATTGASST